MNTISLLLCLLVLPVAGCSILGKQTRFESVHSSPEWTYSSATNRFGICDTTGFVSIQCRYYSYPILTGPVFIPIFPIPFSRKWPQEYKVLIAIQPINGQDSAGLVEDHIHFAFNSPDHIVKHRVLEASQCSEYDVPPCYGNTDKERWINTCSNFTLGFPIHPDSVQTIFVTFDEEFNRRTGLPCTTLQLNRYNQLYYKPVWYQAH